MNVVEQAKNGNSLSLNPPAMAAAHPDTHRLKVSIEETICSSNAKWRNSEGRQTLGSQTGRRINLWEGSVIRYLENNGITNGLANREGHVREVNYHQTKNRFVYYA